MFIKHYCLILIINFFLEAPISVYGEGSYAISAVKEMKVTDEFLGLDVNTRKCQNKELFETCTTRQYLENIREKCNCVPFPLQDFTDPNLVAKFNVHISIYLSLFLVSHLQR